MNRAWCWLLFAALLPLAGCGGSSSGSTTSNKSAAEWMAAGEAALAKDNLDEALAAFDSAVAKDLDSAEARERRGHVYFRQRDFDKAIADCDEALRIDGKLAAAYFTRGEAEAGLTPPRNDQAVEDFSKALDLNSDKVEFLAARGVLYRQMAAAGVAPEQAAKFLDSAVKDFDRALKLNPRDTACLIHRAEIYLDLGDYQAAIDDCDKALEIAPNLAAARVVRARGLIETGEYSKAVLDCDAAIATDDKLMAGYVARAAARVEKSSEMLTLEDIADCDKAADDLQKAIAVSAAVKGDADALRRTKRMRAEVHELRGALYDSIPADKKASDEFTKAIGLDPYLAEALVRRALNRAQTGDHAGALADCNSAIEIDPSRADGYYGRGMVSMFNNDFPAAMKDLNEAITRKPKFAKAYYALAAVYQTFAIMEIVNLRDSHDPAAKVASAKKIGELLRKSIDSATKAIEFNRHFAKAYMLRGVAYARAGMPDRALAEFNAAISADPHLTRAYDNRGLNYLSQYQFSAAVKDFSTVVEMMPNWAPGYLHRAQTYHLMKEPILEHADIARWTELRDRVKQEQEAAIDFPSKKRDSVVERGPAFEQIDKARKALERKLDAAAFP